MQYEVIDFHTHPFTGIHNNICNHIDYCDMSPENTMTYLKSLGISKICGSVICSSEIHVYDRHKHHRRDYKNGWEMVQASNERAFRLQELYGDFYIPGFHVHPGFVKESIALIEEMSKKGVRLIGELVPYLHAWEPNRYSTKAFDEILEAATAYNMVVSLHYIEEEPDDMDELVRNHPDTVIVAAHPCEGDSVARHLKRMEMSENYYLDLSAHGLHRLGVLRHGIDEFGAERFLFGSDYPTCSPATFLGGVLLDTMITPEEKQLILAGNAKRLLGLT